jgi:hypothetical protein
MSPRELRMQPTIHLERKAGSGRGKNPALRSKCIVGCIFSSVGLITTRESPCIRYRRLDSASRDKKLLRRHPRKGQVKISEKLDFSSDPVWRRSKLNGLISSACPTLCAFYTLSTLDPWQCYMLQFPSHNPGLSIL